MKMYKIMSKHITDVKETPMMVLRTGLTAAVAALIAAAILIIVSLNYGDYFLIRNYAEGIIETAAACTFLGVFFGMVCDLMLRENKGKR